jgi:Uri superfamily endonuclease
VGARLEAQPARGRAISRAPGTYALVLESARARRLPVGRLGSIGLRPGFYVYVGSALGPGGLAARIGRHLDSARPLRWHLDYLKRATRIAEIWCVADPVRREHAWANALGSLPDAAIPMRGFGASDCDCPAHLVYFPAAPKMAAFARALARTRGAGNAGTLRRLLPAAYLSLPTGNRGAPTGTR